MKHFIPLESNPSVFTDLGRSLGLPLVLGFDDIFGLDLDSVAVLPRPVYALLLVFPTDDAYEQNRLDNEKLTAPDPDEGVAWFRQTINNACGLYGLLHVVCIGYAR